ncbi:MAG: alpha-L-arabinofuranosidase C-terminal domain-containing protein [Pseudothermotoga sp.]
MSRSAITMTFLFVSFFCGLFAGENSYRLIIDFDKQLHQVPPTLFGIFLEDINHAIDGGLYAQLVRNGSFEHSNPLEGWSVEKSTDVHARIENTDPLNQNNQHYLRISLEKPSAVVSIINEGYDGIYLEENRDYLLSLYAKALHRSSRMTISIQDLVGKIYFTETVTVDSTNWRQYRLAIKIPETVSKGKLVLKIDGLSDLSLDMVSLLPTDSLMGVMRNDLVKMLLDLKPGFVRFPGGCLVEGYNLANAYRWKETIGPIEDRKVKVNLWGYHQSYGIGFDEYFSLSKFLKAEPLPILNAGISCQVRGAQIAPLNDMDQWIQDALDLIEYANGDSSTIWGTKRIDHGFLEPIGLKYLGIGNENWGKEYYERFELFQREIKKNHPQMKLIFSCPPEYQGPSFDEAWSWARRNQVDIVDEHIYASYEWFLANANRYDDYDRSGPKVMVGEYAVHTIGRRNNLQAALGEAAFMTGLERNSDVVIMASYAPLFNRVGWSQWTPDLIWFNNSQVYGTPSYYAQKLFMNNPVDIILSSDLHTNGSIERIVGKIGLGTWKTAVEFDYIKVLAREGKILFFDDFDNDERSWQVYRGTWKTTNGLLLQSSLAEDRRAYFGQTDWSDYTIEVRARKKEGSEGFLVLFGVKNNNNYYWWNIGGYANRSSVIEKAINGQRMVLCQTVPMTVISDEWYLLKVEVNGKRIKCYLNGELVHDIIDKVDYKVLYHSAGYDSQSKEIVLKVVNPWSEDKRVTVEIVDSSLTGQMKIITLASDNIDVENSFTSPTRIYPVERNEMIQGNQFDFLFKKNSITILRLKTQ